MVDERVPQEGRHKLQQFQPPGGTLRWFGLVWLAALPSLYPWVVSWRKPEPGNLIFPGSSSGETFGLSRMKEKTAEKKASRFTVKSPVV